MKNDITIGKWWNQVKDHLEKVANEFPEFARVSDQYKIIHKAAVEGIKLDSLWTAKKAGAIVKAEMEKLTNGLPSFETAHSKASLALLAAFQKCLENYQNVVYSTLEVAGAAAFGEDLQATFPKNAQGAIILEKLIKANTVEIKSGNSPPLPPISGQFSSEITEQEKEEKRELSPEEKLQEVQLKSLEQRLKYYDSEIRTSSNYLNQLKKLEGKHIPGMQEQITRAKDLLETNQLMKQTAMQLMVGLQAASLVDRVVNEIKAYPKLTPAYQLKVREILLSVLEGENMEDFLIDLLGVDQNKFQEGLNSIFQISKKTVEAAIYFENNTCRVNLGGRRGPVLSLISLENALFCKSETTQVLLER